jgi:formylglycine-generating enzyme required for sulfatase activity
MATMACIALLWLPGSAHAAPPSCAADLNGDRVVDGADLGVLLGNWGAPGIGDLDGNGKVDGADLGLMLGAWGSCPTTVPAWATLVEEQPDPAVVTDPSLRAAIVATGYAWRVRDAGTKIEMLLVPPGTFQMGCAIGSTNYPCTVSDVPVHAVTLTKPYYLGRYEVTQSQWFGVMGMNPSYFLAGSTDRPVERVSWNGIQVFLGQSGLRLPTEAEWEFACRAGTQTPFYNGSTDDSTVGALAWNATNAVNQTHPGGQKAPNALGMHDMLGNVAEWVADWVGTYPTSPQTDPTGPATGIGRVLRGGSWYDDSAYTRSSRRYAEGVTLISSTIGFRVARNP